MKWEDEFRLGKIFRCEEIMLRVVKKKRRLTDLRMIVSLEKNFYN